MGNGKVTAEHINQAMNDQVAAQKLPATAEEIEKALTYESKESLRSSNIKTSRLFCFDMK